MTEPEALDVYSFAKAFIAKNHGVLSEKYILAVAVVSQAAELERLRAGLREALDAWEGWVNTEGQYPWGESPECTRISALRSLLSDDGK